MKRIALMLVRNIIYLPVLMFKLFYYASHVDNYTEEEHDKMLKTIVKRANKGGNIVLNAYGIENIPKENGFMLFPNHQGMYDVLALVGTCTVPLAVVAKKEVEKVIFLKKALQCMKSQLLDRDDIRQSLGVIIQVSKEVISGRNYVIFPEGTRAKGNKTLEFKGGSFKAATKAKCPIVPVVLINSFEPFDSKSIKPIIVEVHYLKPISYEEYKEMSTVEIAACVREEIQKRLDHYTEYNTVQ